MPTIDIPGGTAELFLPSEITPRRRKPVAILSSRIGRVVGALQTATRIYCEGDVIEDHTDDLNDEGKPLFTGGDIEVSARQMELLWDMNNASTWALLKSWTLDLPLPSSPDALLDMPGDVYDVLIAEAAKIVAVNAGDMFGTDALGDDPDNADTSLPTSASVA
jgi:hypothetical protein